MRNLEAEAWRYKARAGADAFVYSVDMSALGQGYFVSKGSGGYGGGWEKDRFEIAQLLRTPQLVESPNKPLLLLVQTQDDEVDLERIVNLLGLNGLGRRPFNAVAYSDGKNSADTGVLNEALKWLATEASAKNNDDESTAANTTSDTEEEGSVAASTASSFAFSSSNGGHYVVDYEPTMRGGNPTLQVRRVNFASMLVLP